MILNQLRFSTFLDCGSSPDTLDYVPQKVMDWIRFGPQLFPQMKLALQGCKILDLAIELRSLS
jgi:hypothetical protein